MTVFFRVYLRKLRKYKKISIFLRKKVFKREKLCYNTKVYIYLGEVCLFFAALPENVSDFSEEEKVNAKENQ